MFVEFDTELSSGDLKYVVFTMHERHVLMMKSLLSRVTQLDCFSIPHEWAYSAANCDDFYTIGCWLSDDEMETISRYLASSGQSLVEGDFTTEKTERIV